MSFDTGYCRKAFDSYEKINYTYGSASSAWEPVWINGKYYIPATDADASALASFYIAGVFAFIIANGVTIAAGEEVWYDETNYVVTNVQPTTGRYLGTALAGGTGTSTGSVVADIDINTFPSEGRINIFGSDGLFKAQYATLDLAVAALAANDILVIKAGSYSPAAALTITKAGVKIIGEGRVEINGIASADDVFSVELGALTATAELWFQNLVINHDGDASQVGIQIDNALATKKVNVYINDCEFNTGGANSVDIDHTDTSNAIRLYCKNTDFEGAINAVVADNGDRFRFFQCRLMAGIATGTGDFDAEILLFNSMVLHEGVTGGHANQRCISAGSITETDADPNVYAAVDASDVATQTEQLIAFD